MLLMPHKLTTVLRTLDIGKEMVDGCTVSLFRMAPDTVLPPGQTPQNPPTGRRRGSSFFRTVPFPKSRGL